jgi:hypothetical protein
MRSGSKWIPTGTMVNLSPPSALFIQPLVFPKSLEPIRSEGGVSGCVLNVAVA